MKHLRSSLLSVSLLCAIALAACADRNTPAPTGAAAPDAVGQPSTALGRAMAKGMEQARSELAKGNIELNGLNVSGNEHGFSVTTDRAPDDTRPKAEITPQGELLIDGRKIAASTEQQVLLKEYRGQIEKVALAGMDIGVAGADLGMKAASEAIAAVFSGNGDQVEQRVEAEAAQIEAAAMKLCGQLPAMLDTQTRLASAMPEFRPYATMDQSDVDDCRNGSRSTSQEARHQVRDEIRQQVRGGVRDAVRGAVRDTAQAAGIAEGGNDTSTDAAAEADAAAEQEATTR